ncbi:hypothetical protein [Paramaledivibacter caminithermalis]|uniref:Uncharacterized protein n=1 Tax=Paramaledivibacter caminithermalis (strain DSM 15212 / CIP 107654 / DViRD3) TaxID=1121301 RepID=A0A1M6TBC8_PARC5|nr:hypothetical protein [Paramaledivibacter caminithermalis]SHK54270.1 hypothetical protein SAMN02745912_03626 [Paramaledivibacter caminithermalis DSM 15212]
MKKFNKIMSLILIITIFLGTVNVYAYSEKYPNRITQTIVDEKQFAIQAYKNLDDEAKKVFLSYIQHLALEGDSSLLEYHIKYVDEDYVNQTTTLKKEVDSNTKMMYNMAVASNSSIASQLAALNLPAAVEYGLLALASALGVPVGNVVDVVIGLGLAAVIAIYWDDIKDVWNDIVDIFVDEFGSFVKDAFEFLKAKANGIDFIEPGEKLPNQGKVSDPDYTDVPPVDAGKQGKHVPGHNNNDSSKSQWPRGTTVKPDGSVRVYDFRRPIGPNGETRVKVHKDTKGNIHGYPVD